MNRDLPSTFLLLICLALLLPMASALPTITTTYASNWSGWVATAPGPYTAVNASWTVPSVSAIPRPAYSSTWVGIGGFFSNSSRLIQVGTDQDVLNNGSAVYFAWHEVYPGSPVLVAYISPGDLITASVSQASANASTWHMLVVRNSATLVNITVRARINLASEDTAEFIVERPAMQVGRRDELTTLADFGTVTFSNCTTNQGTLVSIAKAAMVTMKTNATNTGTVLAQPGTLDISTSGFTVQYSAVSSVDEFSSSTPVLILVLISSLLGINQISRNGKKDRTVVIRIESKR
ncbi:MAG: G1 family glutamic endopeptidase [Candidatus Bathyarchaeia archaeon]